MNSSVRTADLTSLVERPELFGTASNGLTPPA